jgi:hypothetical protein
MKNKKMKILLLLAYFATCCTTEKNKRNLTEFDEFILSKMTSLIDIEDFSSQCKSDLNTTIKNYYRHKAWAVASKNIITYYNCFIISF